MKNFLFVVFIFSLLVACNIKIESQVNDEVFFELEIVDSIQVNVDEQLNSIDFRGDKGTMYGYQTRLLTVFDTTGKVLAKRNFPEDGPASLGYIIDIRLLENGDCFVYSFGNKLTLLSEDLEIKKKYDMPFPAELRGARYYRHLVDFKEDTAYLFFPGRDGGNPYLKDFFQKYHVLEKMNLKTGDFEPFFKLPEVSKYHDDLTYEYPSVSVNNSGDLLYVILDTEPLIHIYDLKEGEIKASLDFQPEKFLQKEGSSESSVSSYGEFIRGEIQNVFGFSDGVVVQYGEGVEQDVFIQEELSKQENGYKRPDFNHNKLKVYLNDRGWSNEIKVPAKVKAISGFYGLDKPFWGLRNDDYVNLEEEFITFYKLRLKNR